MNEEIKLLFNYTIKACCPILNALILGILFVAFVHSYRTHSSPAAVLPWATEKSNIVLCFSVKSSPYTKSTTRLQRPSSPALLNSTPSPKYPASCQATIVGPS